MGNAQSQSTEAPRRTSQRLSKPKTGNHATAGLLSPGPFSNSARRLSNAPLPNPPAPSSTVASTPTTSSAVEVSGGLDRRLDSVTSLQSAPGSQRESKRRSLFRSRSSRGADLAQSSQSGGVGARMVDRMTRANSMTYESAVAYYGPTAPESQLVKSESRASWNYNLTSYEAKRLLNLAEEPGLERAATMSENKMTVITETTWKSSNPTQPPSAPITRANSDVSLYMPVRRRSIIQTPGVATRSNLARDLPPLPQLNFRHSHPPTPGLSRQQSVESYRSGVMSMPPRVQDSDSMPRVVTPCEEKYLSIGAFKLGSLRITNGSPSPVTPDIERALANDRLKAVSTVGGEDYFSGAQAPKDGVATTTATQGPAQSPTILPKISHSLTSSITQPQPISPALQTTSKLTALEDQLFDDDAQPEYSSVEVLDVRLDPNAKPPHTEIDRDAGTSVTRTDSGFVSTASPASEVSHKALSKADSGYSSNVSLRSLQTKSQVPENQLTAGFLETEVARRSTKKGASDGSERHSSSSQIGIVHPTMPEREPSPPPVPPKDPARDSWKSGAMHSLAEENKMNATRANRHALNPIATLVSGNRGPASPEREVRSPTSVRSSASDHSSSALSIGGGSQKPSRLQRFLSGARRPAASFPTVHATRALEQSSIPPVPKMVEQKLHEHSGRFPATAKRLALKSRSSLDTLKTIFSVNSIEAGLDAVNSMQNVRSVPEPESKEGLWKQTLTSVPASIANVATHVIPKKQVSRKPVPVRQESTMERDQLGAIDFGSGVSGLSSPVDISSPTRSLKSRGRTMSLTFLAERGMKPRHRMSDFNLRHSTTDPLSPALPSPVAKAMSAESSSRTSQPASTTRRPQSLRVPPPLSMTSLSRKSSRESIQSYPAMHTLTSKTSIDSFQSYSSSQPGAGNGSGPSKPASGVLMDPRRLQSFRQYNSSQSSPYNYSNWELETDHGMTRRTSQTFTTSGSRRNSITSVHSEGGYWPGNGQVWQVRTAQQALRHRASSDGFGYHQRFSQHGHPPSMSNGYTAPVKPVHEPRSRGQIDAAATWSKSQADAAAGQWYQSGQYPPHVPRGHYRNRSMGNRNAHGTNLPYRVLHSYNSPAYRHAPIWG